MLICQAPLITLFVVVVIFTCLKFILTNYLKQKQEDIYNLQDKVHQQLQVESSGNLQKVGEFEKKVESEASKISINIRLIKIALSEWIALPFMLLYYGFWNIVQIIVLVSSEAVLQTKCMFLTPQGDSIQIYLNISSAMVILIIIFVCAVIIVTDFVVFMVRKKGCDIIGYFREDKLFFRFEMILIIIIGGIAALIQVVIPFVRSNANEWVSKSIVIIVEASLLYAVVGNIFLISIIKHITQKRKTIDPTILLEVLNEKKGFELFSNFTKLEWSQENILLYNEIQKYKELVSYRSRAKRSAEIYKTYISSYAPIMVNLPHDVKKRFHDSLNTLKEEDSKEWNEIFKTIEGEVLLNMKDSFKRFTSTNEYMNWAKQYHK